MAVDKLEIAEDIDELIENVIKILGEETEWHRRFDDDSTQLNILGKLRVRLANEFKDYKQHVIDEACENDCVDVSETTDLDYREPQLDAYQLD